MTEITDSRETNTQVPMSTGERAQSPFERVTEKKATDPKVVATGRAGAADQTTAQKRLLEQRQAAMFACIPPKGADRERSDEWPDPMDHRSLSSRGIHLRMSRVKHALARQSRVGVDRPRTQSPG